MIPRRLKWIAMIVLSGIFALFSFTFYKIWWNISIISHTVKTSSYLRANIDVTGLENAGLMCFVIATLIVIIIVVSNLYVWWTDEN